MKALRLQTRVALACALVISIGLLVCCLAVILIARHEAVEEVDHQLRAEAAQFFAEWKRHGGADRFDLATHPDSINEWLPARNPQRLAEIVQPGEVVLYRSRPAELGNLGGQPEGLHTVQSAGRAWRCLAIARNGVLLRLAANLQPVREVTTMLFTAFAVAVPLLTGLAILAGRLVARRTLEPIRQMAAAAERITAEQLDEPVPVPAASDEIRRLALVLNETFARLRGSFAQAQRFSADASHELKTPLTVLRSGLEAVLESSTLSTEDEVAIAALLEQTQRLTAITQSLLLLSRADAGRLKLDLAPTDLPELLQACLEDARILGEQAEVTIEEEIPTVLRAHVEPGRLSQIIVNLLDNAVKYNRPGGRVQLVARSDKEAVRIVVGNTGVPIPADHAAHLFERFFRGAVTLEAPGHGLGLSLSRELARAHGGELTLLSSAGDWTEFELRLRGA